MEVAYVKNQRLETCDMKRRLHILLEVSMVLEHAQEYIHLIESIFLTYQKDNKCSIHKTRPRVCRKFFCTDNNFKSMIDKINEYKNKLLT